MARPAYVLPSSAVSGTDPVTFPGFPGIWTPEQPIAAAELARHGGMTEDEVADQVEELGLPLEPAEVGDGDGTMPLPPNHRESRDQAAAAALEDARPRARSHKDLDAQADELGLTFSKTGLSRDDKQAEIDAHIAAAELVPDPPEPAGEDE